MLKNTKIFTRFSILDAPTFRSLPKDVEAEIGTTVTLSCDVDGYPPPEIRWLHHEEDQMIVSILINEEIYV